jgi:hypothetical protein
MLVIHSVKQVIHSFFPKIGFFKLKTAEDAVLPALNEIAIVHCGANWRTGHSSRRGRNDRHGSIGQQISQPSW